MNLAHVGSPRWLKVCLLLFACGIRLDAQTGQDEFRSLLQEAFSHHQRSEYAQALPLLKRAYRLEPHDYFVNLLLGIEYLRTGDTAGALPRLKEAAQRKPAEEIPHEYLGETYAKLSRFPDAYTEYELALRAPQPSTEAITFYVDYALERYRQLAQTLRSTQAGLAESYRLQAYTRKLGDPERVALLQRAIATSPKQPQLWSDLALSQIAAGDWDEANKSVDQALAANSNDLRAWRAQALLHAHQQRWSDAIVRLKAIAARSTFEAQEAVSAWPGTVMPDESAMTSDSSGLLGCIATRDCDWPVVKKAADANPEEVFRRQEWERVVALAAPAQPAGWSQKGIAFAALKQCAKAIPALERGAVGKEPEVLSRLSYCYALRAGEVAQKLQQSNDPAAAHLVHGDVLLRLQGDATAALAEYQQAGEAHQQDPAFWERVAEAQLATGQMDEAKASAEHALQLDPHRVSPTRTLAKVAMESRDYQEALPFLRDLATRDPQDVTARVDLATACAQTGSTEEALKLLSPVLEQGYPDEKGSLHNLLGTILRKLKRTAEADLAFARAKELSDRYQATSRREP